MPNYRLAVAPLLSLLVADSSAFPTRLNLGASEPWTDNEGQVWEPETLGGTAIDDCAAPIFFSFENRQLLCSRTEWQSTSGDIEIAVPDRGLYQTTLYFSEVGASIGDRNMDVFLEGVQVVSDLDVVEAIGGSSGFYTLTLRRFITDLSVTVVVSATQGRPALAGIEVTRFVDTPSPVAAPPPPTSQSPSTSAPTVTPPTPTAPVPNTLIPTAVPPTPTVQLPGSQPQRSWNVNVGSSAAFTGSSGVVWQPDFLTSGEAVDQCSVFTFFGIDNAELYCEYRQWADGGSSGVLDFPVERGFYTTRLYISETFAVPGERVVDIFFEGSLIASDVDVAERLGGSYGLLTYTISRFIADGAISLELRASNGSPVLAAVEIFEPAVGAMLFPGSSAAAVATTSAVDMLSGSNSPEVTITSTSAVDEP